MIVAKDFSVNSPSLYNDPAGKEPGHDKTLTIHAMVMWRSSRTLQHVIFQIEDTWREIGRTWDDLKLGWTGSSSEEAQAFNDKLQRAQNEMFGRKGVEEADADQPGIMRLLRGKAMGASNHYGQTEQAVMEIFDDFTAALVEKGDGKPSAPVDISDGPIKIDYDNHNGVRYQSNRVIGQWMGEDGRLHELRESGALPTRHERVVKGRGWEVTWTIDEIWIDHEGHEHKNTVPVLAASWKDDKGMVSQVLGPNVTEPLKLPDGVS